LETRRTGRAAPREPAARSSAPSRIPSERGEGVECGGEQTPYA